MDRNRLSRSLSALYDLVSRLRGIDGCPWDALQTDSTVKMYLLEEAYEVLDAIERGSPEDVCQELGDLLFQIMFLAGLAEERGEFDFVKVIEGITEKMRDRHPHVFGQTDIRSAEEVAENWQKIKKREKDAPKTFSTLLQGVPIDLPALLRAHRLSERASRADFDWPHGNEGWGEVEERVRELGKTISSRDKERIGQQMGDLLFGLATLARHWGLNAENLLRDANQRFIERVKEVEQELKALHIEPDQVALGNTERSQGKGKIKAE